METRTAELADELIALYGKAETGEAYKEVEDRGNEAMAILKDESFDVAVPVLLPGLWAKYDLLLKFPILSSMNEDRKEFLGRVQWWLSCSRVKSPENRIALSYLESMILKNLLNNYARSQWCIIGIKKIIAEEEEISIALTLKLINLRGAVEMANKNWIGAVGIFNEIDEFPKKILWQPENSKSAADLLSDRGISQIRAGSNIWSGIRDLATAAGYYQQKEEVPEDLKNRLREAIEKL